MDTIASENRREWLRLDERLLFEYWPVGEESVSSSDGLAPAGDAEIAEFLSKPTTDLLARLPVQESEPVLAPWLMKIDYVLTLVLKTLLRLHPEGVPLPRLTDVNISAGGLSFPSTRSFGPGELVDVRLILPPFTPIHARAEVIRVTADQVASGLLVAVKFVDISPDDQERLIKHILSVQAKRVRLRNGPP